MPSFTVSLRTRATLYIIALLAINFYFVKDLFFAEFTGNMQTNSGSFMAITRFILQYWPHLDWFPRWFNGEPFENAYTPMLHLIDAAFAWVTGCSTARAYNFVTAFLCVTGPVFVFLFCWRVSRFLETSFLAALFYSLFSPCVLFPIFRADVGGIWNPWRLRVLIYYGEGPHTAILSTLPLVLLLVHFALQTRRYIWCAAATAGMAFLVLLNAFGAVDLGVGCACLVLALRSREISRGALLLGAMAIAAYLWASPFLTPALIHTVAVNSTAAEGDFSVRSVLPAQCVIAAGFICLWLGTRWIGDYLTRFTLMFTFVFLAILASSLIWNRAALPQPHRYSIEMEFGFALALAFSLRPLVLRLPHAVWAVSIVVGLILVVHQTIHFRRYARAMTQKIDVTQTIEYKVAMAMDRIAGRQRAFVTGQAGTWLNVFSDTPQMNSGHEPFNPNWVEGMATYTIFSGQNAGTHDAEFSILWLKAFGCHAIYVPGPRSRLDGKPFNHPGKFNGVLPVLWHQEDDTIYAVPQRTKSLAHVLPEDAVVKHRPINGLDTGETARYVAALDDEALPPADMTWSSPGEGHIRTILRPGQVLSVQVTYEKGWVAIANGRPAAIAPDGIGLTEIHAPCDGDCAVDFIFDGGWERKICRALSWTVSAGALLGGFVAFRRRKGAR